VLSQHTDRKLLISYTNRLLTLEQYPLGTLAQSSSGINIRHHKAAWERRGGKARETTAAFGHGLDDVVSAITQGAPDLVDALGQCCHP
jgi:hypothetical protein